MELGKARHRSMSSSYIRCMKGSDRSNVGFCFHMMNSLCTTGSTWEKTIQCTLCNQLFPETHKILIFPSLKFFQFPASVTNLPALWVERELSECPRIINSTLLQRRTWGCGVSPIPQVKVRRRFTVSTLENFLTCK